MSAFRRPVVAAAIALAFIVAAAAPFAFRAATARSHAALSGLDEIRVILKNEVDAGVRAGFVAGIATSDGVAYRTAAGFADRESKAPMTLTTRFRIASMTKPIVTAAVMQLVERGALSLEDPVARFIPAFANARVALSEDPGADGAIPTRAPARAMTIRDLLTHTAGIGYLFSDKTALDRLYLDAGRKRDGKTLEDLANRLAEIPLYSDPGAAWRYSYSIDLAGLVVEAASGEPLEDYVRGNLLEPLGMTQTQFIIDAGDLGRAATIYEFDSAGAMRPAPGDDIFGDPNREGFGIASGGGGLISTLDDYLRFCRMMLRGGELDGVRVLAEQSVKAMMSDQLEPGSAALLWERDFASFGLGGLVVTDPGKAAVTSAKGEWGWSGYWDTWFVVDPNDDIAVVLLAQTQSGPHTPDSNARNAVKEIAYAAARR